MGRLDVIIVPNTTTETSLLRQQLEQLGHNVVREIQPGPEMLRLIGETKPDIALLEIGPAGTNGLEIIPALREEYPLPLVILSTQDDPDLALQAHAAGVGAYLLLPASNSELTWALTVARLGPDVQATPQPSPALPVTLEPVWTSQMFADKVIDTVQALVLGLDSDGKIVYFNDYCEQVTGWRRKEVLGKHWLTQFLPARLRPPVRSVLNALGESTDQNEYENAILTRSGQERIVSWHNTVIRNKAGEVSLILATGIDVTERRQAEDILYPLNAAALAAQQTLEPQKIFQIIARKLSTMGLGCTVLLSDEQQDNLEITFTTISSLALDALGKLLGLKPIGSMISIKHVGLLQTICRERRAILASDMSMVEQAIRQMLPKNMADRAGQIIQLLDMPPFIAAPMVAGKALIGVLLVHAPGLSEPQVPAVTAFAYQVASAVENARLYEQAQREIADRKRAEAEREHLLLAEREQRLLAETLGEVALALTSQISFSAVLDEILRQTRRIVPYNAANITLLEDDLLRTVRGHGYQVFGNAESISTLPQPLDDFPLNAEVVRSQKPLVIADTHQEPNWVRLEKMDWIRSHLTAPICLRDQTLGLLRLDSDTPDHFHPADAERLRPLVNAAAIALENARLFEAERAQAQRQAVLFRLSAELATTLQETEVCQRVVDGLRDTLSYSHVAIFMVDRITGERVLMAYAGCQTTPLAQWRIPPGQGLSELPLLDGQPHYTPDVSCTWRHIVNIERVQKASPPIGSEVDVPLRLGDKIIGVLAVESDQINAFNRDDLEMIISVGNQISIAVEKARLFEAQARRRQEAETLREVTTALTLTLNLDEVLDLILERLRTVVPYESGAIGLLKDDMCYLAAANDRQRAEQLWGQGLSPEKLPLVARVLNEHRAVIVADTQELDDWVMTKGSERIRSWLGVPLVVKDRTIGLLMLNHTSPGFYNQESRRLATAFAQHATLAIENAQLHEAQRQQAVELARLHRASATLFFTNTPDLSVLAQNIVEVVLLEFGQANCSLLLINPTTGEFERIGAAGPYTHQVTQVHLKLDGSGLVPLAARTGQIINVSDVTAHPDYFTSWDQARSEMTVPLKVGDRVTGVLDVQSSHPAAFGPIDERLLTTFAERVALVLENARLYNAVQEYARSLQIAAWENEQLLKQLQRHTETLEQEVAARTAEIFAEKEKVEAILKSAGDAIVITDPEGRISFVNDALSTLTGHPSHKVIGQLAQETLLNGHTPPTVMIELQHAREQGVPWRGDILIGHRDGHAFECDMTLAPVLDENGQVISYVNSMRDVSQARALERAKSEFLTNVSHQLRTPLTNLKTYAYLLGKGSLERQSQYVQTVQAEVEKLLQLVQDLIEVVELDAGPIIAIWRPVSPNELLTTMVARYESLVQASGLTLTVVSPDQVLPNLMGSNQRLAQMLSKILDNALNFTKEGKIVLDMQLVNETASNTEIVFSISDTGPGIPPDEMAHLFERFFRGQVARPGHILGTGLGLSVAKMIAQAHGGRVEVQSQLEQGSTFSVRLPVPD